jgi:hypothetical protein
MEALTWVDALWRLLLGGLLALLPGLIFWITVLGLFLLIRKIGRALGLGRMKGEPGTETA